MTRYGSQQALYKSAGFDPCCFFVPNWIVPSCWLEHAPFCLWLVGATHPRTFVELGVQRGFSYFAFCQAVKQLETNTNCYAVDHWRGDKHAGFYGDEVFLEVAAHNESYASFSSLIRSTFSDAVDSFADKSIDLLHVDGQHFYDDVKIDFETWAPKLSDRAVVLFHDTRVRERGFGVWQFWQEVSACYPSFEFEHGNGLGVLSFGSQVPKKAKNLFLAEGQTAQEIRHGYALLGAAISAIADREAARVIAEREGLQKLQAKMKELEFVQRELSSIKGSTFWKITLPLRLSASIGKRIAGSLWKKARTYDGGETSFPLR